MDAFPEPALNTQPEECGDGIMSAIDMYTTVDTVTGMHVRLTLRDSHLIRRFTEH